MTLVQDSSSSDRFKSAPESRHRVLFKKVFAIYQVLNSMSSAPSLPFWTNFLRRNFFERSLVFLVINLFLNLLNRTSYRQLASKSVTM